MSADGVESSSDRTVCGPFPEIPDDRRIAVERFLARRPEFVPYASNLLRRPNIAPLAVDMLLKFEEFEAEERTRRETVPEGPRATDADGQDAWLNRVSALSADDLQRLAVELDGGIGQHCNVADQ